MHCFAELDRKFGSVIVAGVFWPLVAKVLYCVELALITERAG